MSVLCCFGFTPHATTEKGKSGFLGRADGDGRVVSELGLGHRARGTHQDQLEQRGLVHLDELGVEGGFLFLLVALFFVLRGVELGVLDHLGEDLRGDVGQGNGGVRAGVCVGKAVRGVGRSERVV